jgi:hypothetical protein
MGMLDDRGGEHDYQAVFDVAWSISQLWNNFGGEQHGFKIKVGKAQIKECCRIGDDLLIQSKKFPNPPSPFKRVAALIVTAKLFPFYQQEPSPLSPAIKQIWLSRIVALLIPGALSVLEVNVSNDEKYPKMKTLDNWNGFASPHYKIEFLKWVQWLDGFDWLNVQGDREMWDQLNKDRMARMIMATSLIIEANYYIGETGPPQAEHLRGKCKLCLKNQSDLTPLTYDAEIFDNAAKAGFTK